VKNKILYILMYLEIKYYLNIFFLCIPNLNSWIFRCYATKWEQNINHCSFLCLCIGFHRAKSSQVSSSYGMKEVSSYCQDNHHLYKHLEDGRWIIKLAYMTDILEHLNELNIKMQGNNENILTSSDKLKGFKRKNSTLENCVTRGTGITGNESKKQLK